MQTMLLANKFNMEGRYPEYVQNMGEISNKVFAERNIGKIKSLIQWFKQNLQ